MGVTVIYLGGRLPDPSSSPPESNNGPDRPVTPEGVFSLLDLAPGGVYLAGPVTRPAGELLPHRFTLTARTEAREAVYFLLHFP